MNTQKEITIPNYYKLASDNDFVVSHVGDYSYFKYIGKYDYIIIPEVIHGEVVTSYWKMFENSNVKGVASTSLKVERMTEMFRNSQEHKLDLRFLETKNVKYMNSMFIHSEAREINLINFDTSNVKTMADMFCRFKGSKLDLSSFNTLNVTDTSYMFDRTCLKEVVGFGSMQLN